jgi:hypothetical protein
MGTVGTSKEASGAPDENLCPADFDAKLAALSDTDKLKLSQIEDHLRRDTGMKPGELQHEVVCRVWLGKRHCPAGVSVMAFFVNAMKSIAGHERTRRKGQPSLHAVSREGQMAPAATALAPEVDAAAQLVVDRVAHSVETVEAIIALFDGDEAAQFVIIAWSDGLRGAELRAETGLDQSAIDYAAKRIRKKMREKYPEGWIE